MAIKIWSNKHVGVYLSRSRPQDKSANIKTGDMAQTSILALADTPSSIYKSGRDGQICGTCPLRSKTAGGNGGCYVNPSWQNGIWHSGNESPGEMPRPNSIAKPVRIGAYGDPAKMPVSVVRALAQAGRGWTGYTHAWRTAAKTMKQYLMASCDSARERARAKKDGWRTFRIAPPGPVRVLEGETLCPNTTHKIQCSKCLLCSGTAGRGKTDIVIEAHGSHVSAFGENK